MAGEDNNNSGKSRKEGLYRQRFLGGRKIAKPIAGDHRTSAMEHRQGFAATRVRRKRGACLVKIWNGHGLTWRNSGEEEQLAWAYHLAACPELFSYGVAINFTYSFRLMVESALNLIKQHQRSLSILYKISQWGILGWASTWMKPERD